jgi:hypothetical protein
MLLTLLLLKSSNYVSEPLGCVNQGMEDPTAALGFGLCGECLSFTLVYSFEIQGKEKT